MNSSNSTEQIALPLSSWERLGEGACISANLEQAKAALGSLGEAVLNKLSKSERAGWEWLASKGSAKSSEYAAGMNVDERTARRHLNQFLKLGLARKIGASTSTEYEIA